MTVRYAEFPRFCRPNHGGIDDQPICTEEHADHVYL